MDCRENSETWQNFRMCTYNYAITDGDENGAFRKLQISETQIYNIIEVPSQSVGGKKSFETELCEGCLKFCDDGDEGDEGDEGNQCSLLLDPNDVTHKGIQQKLCQKLYFVEMDITLKMIYAILVHLINANNVLVSIVMNVLMVMPLMIIMIVSHVLKVVQNVNSLELLYAQNVSKMITIIWCSWKKAKNVLIVIMDAEDVKSNMSMAMNNNDVLSIKFKKLILDIKQLFIKIDNYFFQFFIQFDER